MLLYHIILLLLFSVTGNGRSNDDTHIYNYNYIKEYDIKIMQYTLKVSTDVRLSYFSPNEFLLDILSVDISVR